MLRSGWLRWCGVWSRSAGSYLVPWSTRAGGGGLDAPLLRAVVQHRLGLVADSDVADLVASRDLARQLTTALPSNGILTSYRSPQRFADEVILVVNPCPQADPPARLLQCRSTSLRFRF